MAFLIDILEDIQRGNSYFSGLHQEYTQDLYKGCSDCKPLKYDCLKRIMRALGFKVELDEYDDVAKELWRQMILIIGDYTIQIPPTVDAGANQTKTVGESGTATAVATAGSAQIVSYAWTKLSGGSITLTNANTATVSFSNFGAGTFVLQVTVTDSNGLTASDSFTLTANAVQIQVRWDAFDTMPDLNTMVLTKSMTVNAGFTEATIDFEVDFGEIENKYIAYDYPATEADKVNWFNTVLNYGTVPDSAMRAQVIAGGRKRIGSRDFFIFDSSTYTLKIS